jgi:hypothetical protein
MGRSQSHECAADSGPFDQRGVAAFKAVTSRFLPFSTFPRDAAVVSTPGHFTGFVVALFGDAAVESAL